MSRRFAFRVAIATIATLCALRVSAVAQLIPLGNEFQVNVYTVSGQNDPDAAGDGAGNFVVVWSSYDQDGDYWGIFARRYDSNGAPLGTEFQVNSYTPGYQYRPAVGAARRSGRSSTASRSTPTPRPRRRRCARAFRFSSPACRRWCCRPARTSRSTRSTCSPRYPGR